MTTKRTQPLALAYIRVSTVEQVDSGASLDAQRRTLTDEAERRGWAVEVVADEGLSAKNMKRPGLQSALDRLDKGEADYLLAIRIDRVSRSVSDFAGLMDRATRKGWGMVMLSPNVDTSDPAGRFTSNVLASAAQYERELIGMRTKEGMAEKKAKGQHLGSPRLLSAEVVERIVAMKQDGASLRAIGSALEAEGVTTARGGTKWHASTIKAVLESSTAKGCYLG